MIILSFTFDASLKIEAVLLLICLMYLLASWKKEPHITKLTVCAMMSMISYDIFVLHGEKTIWGLIGLNAPALFFIYVKIIKKALIYMAQRFMVWFFMLLGTD